VRARFFSWLWPPSGQALWLLFFLTFLFQILLISRLQFLYILSLVLFFFLLLYLLASLTREIVAEKNLVLWLLILLVLLVRLPFFFYPRGLIFTSDNALDALQTQEIASTHLPPFFLLNALQHMGTIKYTFASFFWELFGHHYLLYTLTQVLMYLGMLYCLYLIFRPSVEKSPFLLFILFGFSGIETWFDNSLSLRAGSEFEMAFFFLLGAALVERGLISPRYLFLAFYLAFFSIYLHTLGASFAVSLAATLFLVFLFRQPRRLWRGFFFPLISGASLALFHWVYYRLFVPKPPSLGGWERIGFRLPSGLSLELIKNWLKSAQACFINLFNFELKYMLTFFGHSSGGTPLRLLNRGIIILSFLVLIAALVLALKKVYHFFRRRETALTTWPSLFFLGLSLAFLVKTLLLEPPLLEPRHNFDLLIVITFAYFITFGQLTRLLSRLLVPNKVSYILPGFIFLLFLGFTWPHQAYYLKMAQHKEALYKELMATLSKNRVRYLATDFIIAYPIYFFSGKRVLVSDSLGPLTIPQFFPEMRDQVDNIPLEHKAYLFFTEQAPTRAWHKKATAVLKARLIRDLKKAGLSYRTIKIQYFVLFLPLRSP